MDPKLRTTIEDEIAGISSEIIDRMKVSLSREGFKDDIVHFFGSYVAVSLGRLLRSGNCVSDAEFLIATLISERIEDGVIVKIDSSGISTYRISVDVQRLQD